MIKIERYSPAKKNQWNDFVRTSKNGFFMFDRGYMDYHSDRFDDFSLMAYNDQNKLVAILPANIKDNILHSHQGLTFGGFIMGRKMRTPLMMDVFDQLSEFLKENKVDKLIYKAIPYFYHSQPSQEDIYALYRNNAQCVRVDVSSTINYQNSPYTFSSSRKSGLAKAKSLDLEIKKDNDYESFFEMMNHRLEEKYDSQSTHTADEMLQLSNAFSDNISLYSCFKDGNLLAGIITYETESVVHTQYIGSSEEGRDCGAVDFLLDELINRKFKHKSYFDFGISTEKQGNYLNDDLISQKEGTGARATVHQIFELTI